MDLEDLLVESSIQLESLSRQAGHLAHNLLVGQTREQLFENILGRNLIPYRYGIGGGRVVGIGGKMSREVDIVFYDKLDCPRFMPTESTIFPSLGVHGIAEIKSTLDKNEIEDSVAKIAAFKTLYQDEPQLHPFGTRFTVRQGKDPMPFGIVFAFGARTQLGTLLNNLTNAESDLAPELRCELVVVNGVGLIARSNDGVNPVAVWPAMGLGMPKMTIAIASKHKTLGIFYPLLTAMLASVPTFPVNPALYGRASYDLDGHSISGQFREINAETKTRETLKDSFLRALIAWVVDNPATTLAELEQKAFVEKGLAYEAMGDRAVWLYDPSGDFSTLDFPPIDIGGMKSVRTLANRCLVVLVDDSAVLVPRLYLSPATVETLER